MQLQEQLDNAFSSPSFSSYSTSGLSSIAAKVTNEFQNLQSLLEEEDDFEFSILLDNNEDLTTNEVIKDGRIRPVLPIFNGNIIKHNIDDHEIDGDEEVSTISNPLRKLFEEDRSSTSSSESDELEQLPAESYCVWSPKNVDSLTPSRWNKSRSTGSVPELGSKRWRLCDLLLRRSNSDGDRKGPYMFLIKNHKEDKNEGSENVHDNRRRNSNDGVRKVKAGSVLPSPTRSSPHEVFYIRNRAEKEEGKRRSYLPYKRDLFGLLASVHGIGR